jgi:hypothetical protein
MFVKLKNELMAEKVSDATINQMPLNKAGLPALNRK